MWLANATFGLAFITVIGFLIAYLFEARYVTYFNIPRSFISTSFNHLFDALLRFAKVIFFIIWALFINLIFQSSLCLEILSSLILILGPLFIYTLKKIQNFTKAWRLWAFMATVIIIYPYLLHYSLSTPIIRISQGFALECNNELLLAITILVVCFIVAYCVGRFDAITQIKYMTVQIIENTNGPFSEFVLLRVYGDKFICAKLEKRAEGKTPGLISNEFRIIKITPDVNLVLKLEKVGPLELRKNK